MKNVTITTVIIVFIMIIGILSLSTLVGIKLYKAGEKGIDKYEARKEYIGSKVIVDKDTVTILDYDFFGGIYTLSNGVKASHEYVNKHFIPE